ncbi:BgTH12-02040 [Blumeria graminis f. sp. triticale]|uniref:Kynureninase n=1 Tax=Blumeria graminis f. sp. triticale TaxID=1689686 RepID=A0A9W4DHD9_BLUGR|nr:BgTH12-02040 [Blumeria graminis f. sp. triticale]
MSTTSAQNSPCRDEIGREHAVHLDSQDPLRHTRELFLIPTLNQVKAETIEQLDGPRFHDSSPESVYLSGNSLGLQPRITSIRLQQHLLTWASQGVQGHMKTLRGSSLPQWLDADVFAAEKLAFIVGARPSEVAIMATLSANLHLLMSAFYKPDRNGRHRIIIESQAFPSDNFVAESQIRHHDLDPSTSLLVIQPPPQEDTISTSQILSVIEEYAASTAILLLPGIQYYTGQLLDIPTITAAANKAGILTIWDLAHAIGNVELKLHEWNVDAAVWCSYKYLNAGPGSIGGMFVHEKHYQVSSDSMEEEKSRRLCGWWGSQKASRFIMDNQFVPIPGAGGFQLSNPSILDITSLAASLEIFQIACLGREEDSSTSTGILPLRNKSMKLTRFLEACLENLVYFKLETFRIITPADPQQRGAQLSLRLEPGLSSSIMAELSDLGVIIDERKPDVLRVTPVPLYNTFLDCWLFVEAFESAIATALLKKDLPSNPPTPHTQGP